MSRPQATVRRVGRRPTAIPNSEFCPSFLLTQKDEFSTAKRGGKKARQGAVQGSDANPFSAQYLPSSPCKSETTRKTTLIPSI